MSDSLPDRLNAFLSAPICQQGSASLKKNVGIRLYLDGQGPHGLRREGGGVVFEDTPPEDPEVTVHIPAKALEELEPKTSGTLPELGIAIAQQFIHSDESVRLKLEIHTGFLTLWTKGYFGILTSGGPEFMKYLATRGLSSLDKIKEAIQQMRTKS